MHEPILLDGASQDYRDAYAWYHGQGPALANSFEAEIGWALEQISKSPQQFAKYDQQHRCLMLKRFPYLVIYRFDVSSSHVIAIAHTKRRPGYWRENRG